LARKERGGERYPKIRKTNSKVFSIKRIYRLLHYSLYRKYYMYAERQRNRQDRDRQTDRLMDRLTYARTEKWTN
jgi:hypothetical protein